MAAGGLTPPGLGPAALEADGLFDRIRAACAGVADRAALVAIDEEALDRLADDVLYDIGPGVAEAEPPLMPEERPSGTSAEDLAAEVLAWNAVNFGSGWFPQVRKRPGLSGARSLASAFGDHVRRHGPPTVDWLVGVDAAACGELFDQPHPGPVDDLLELFAQAWNDLGRLLGDGRFGGSAAALVRSAGGSAERLAATLATMPLAQDVSRHAGAEVPLLKRAQITASHLARAAGGRGVGWFTDLDRVTAFADNLVPHTLRMAGVLRYDAELADRIARGELLTSGEAAEVEIRACGVHAVELLAASTGLAPATLDHYLWQAGQDPAVKVVPRHRCRTPWY
ncbi:MAG TPA: queuosine salvage family protein [Acidimicrobiales bacterium]|nr:queuosine salvage family protein [Acidimicrobiales bacterium]